MLKRKLSANEKQKVKMKKNALDCVDIEEEKRLDPKYKTELCKSWMESRMCIYGNRCRFAHGKQELFEKQMNNMKYKQKECKSFTENGYCLYGTRCNFKHEERKLKNIPRSFYLLKLSIMGEKSNDICQPKRLKVFEEITGIQTEKMGYIVKMSNWIIDPYLLPVLPWMI